MTAAGLIEAARRLEAAKADPDSTSAERVAAAFAYWRAMIERGQEIGRGLITQESRLGEHDLLEKMNMKRKTAVRLMALARMTIDWNSIASVTKAIMQLGDPNWKGAIVVVTTHLALGGKGDQ